MSHDAQSIRTAERISPEDAGFEADVRDGLARAQKQLPPKYLYDALGSALFEAICALPEYGLSRAGERLLVSHASKLCDYLDRPLRVVDLGSGGGRKLRLLLEGVRSLDVRGCAAIDLSSDALARTRGEVEAVVGPRFDALAMPFSSGLRHALRSRAADEQVLVAFLGSNIGNYARGEEISFLQDVRAALRPGDALLLGVDLVKPVDVLLRAYDDSLGVTAAFDKNLLVRINRELDARFDLALFEHVALWNETQRRVEMHLRSRVDQVVAIPGAEVVVELSRGETIWTESSHKYSLDDIRAIAQRCGFETVARWIDPEWPFVHALLVAAPGRADQATTRG
jgi:L-histidine N-alpha-methyltransferase